MTTLLDRIRGLQESSEADRQAAIEKNENDFIAIAIRDASGKNRKGDAERLLEVMESLGRTESDYMNLIKSIKEVCTAFAEREFLDQTLPGLEDLSEQAKKRQELLQAISIRLHAASGAYYRISDRQSRLAMPKKLDFMTNKEGELAPALRPLVEKQLEQRIDAWESATKSARELMGEDEFFAKAQELCISSEG
jgi:hypothetical protein